MVSGRRGHFRLTIRGACCVSLWHIPPMNMNRAKLARLLLLASVLYVTGFYFIGSAIKPGYSQISNFVSEYNATGTPRAQMLTYAGFAATSAILVAFLVTASPLS